jgi:hypothetical protein
MLVRHACTFPQMVLTIFSRSKAMEQLLTILQRNSNSLCSKANQLFASSKDLWKLLNSYRSSTIVYQVFYSKKIKFLKLLEVFCLCGWAFVISGDYSEIPWKCKGIRLLSFCERNQYKIHVHDISLFLSVSLICCWNSF